MVIVVYVFLEKNIEWRKIQRNLSFSLIFLIYHYIGLYELKGLKNVSYFIKSRFIKNFTNIPRKFVRRKFTTFYEISKEIVYLDKKRGFLKFVNYIKMRLLTFLNALKLWDFKMGSIFYVEFKLFETSFI